MHTIRYTIEGSVEDGIIEMQKRKMKLTDITFKEGQGVDDLSVLENKKRKRVDVAKDKEKAQQQKLTDLKMMFNIKTDKV